ncbi:hypothetical protein J8M20_04735 [Pseudoalteromonas luteoviolacea]|uniref:hypothetical protein n=1 Tax=Pseudoalteromonas luteoviolacea TaxID=43657 RepID=UPI001B35C5ED|nr:hypothetical protein [Pseudoalteromonas luteoviolacea]MBQ4810626.1 hypothetical protein [Pseudoalteromonas luteoviolacea]
MKTILKTLAVACALSTSAGVMANNLDSEQQRYVYDIQEIGADQQANFATPQAFITTELVRGWILDGAKSAIKGGVKDFLKGMLFGSEPTGPQIVRLHEEDLQRIEQLVSGVVITDAVYSLKSDLAAFGTTFDYYQDSLNGTNFDSAILASLLQYVNSLQHHRAYDANYNSNAYALTTSYSTMATLNLAVLTERHVKGFLSASYVKYQAGLMADKLSQLGNLVNTRAARLGGVRMIGSRCWDIRDFSELKSTELHTDQIADYSDAENMPMAPLDCIYIASFPGKSSRFFNASQMGDIHAEEAAYEWLMQMRAEYRTEIKGADFDEVVSKLRSL